MKDVKCMTKETINNINNLINRFDELEDRIEYLSIYLNNVYFRFKLEITRDEDFYKCFYLSNKELEMLIENYQKEILYIKNCLKINYNVTIKYE